MKTEHSFVEGSDRYAFDFNLCSSDKGWAQFDHRNDAFYYGCWINPVKRKFMRYCEGDVTEITFDNNEEMAAYAAECLNSGHTGIDPGLGGVLLSECIAHGLGPYLHKVYHA